MRKISFIFILLTSFIVSSTALAEPHRELTQFVKTEMQALRSAMAHVPTNEDSEFSLKRFLVRLQAKFGIEVPFLAKFQVIPELEVIVQKDSE